MQPTSNRPASRLGRRSKPSAASPNPAAAASGPWSAANASSRNGPCSKAGTVDASLRRALRASSSRRWARWPGPTTPDPDMRSRAAKLAEIDRLSQHSRSERCLSTVVAAVTGALSPEQEGARISALKVESLTHAENVARPNG